MVFQFNKITLDTAQYRLCMAGSPISVEPQVFDLLVYLLENRDRVVTRGELLENLWKNKVVTDSALGARIKDARKAVGDNGDRQEVIKTFHGRGYQFIAEVSKPGPTESISNKEAMRFDEVLPLSDKPSIVVLPFTSLGADSADDYFADGLTADIISNLSRYRELFVIDAESAFVYRDGANTAENFAHQLGVEYLAKGNIRRSRDQVRISAQLIEAATGKTMWAERMDRNFDELFTLEDEIAARIAASLVSHIDDESNVRAARKHPESMTAFDCVIRARKNALSYDPDENASGRNLLEQAIDQDQEYAAAYACLAWSCVIESESDWCASRQGALEQAVVFARKAVALDEFDSNAHVGMGWAYMYLKKYDLAETHLDRAIECNPNDYNAFCIKSWLLAVMGRAAEVKVCGATALHLNPLAPDQCLMAMIVAHYMEGQYQEALDMLARIQESNGDSEALRAACLAQLGLDEEAHIAAASACQLGGDFIQSQDWLDIYAFKSPTDLKNFLDGLRKSGVLKHTSVNSEKPSIAVLQFANHSDDPKQQYFSEGMATNICSRLSRVRSLLVKSGYNFDSNKTPLSQISKELEVDYLLAGSVQREDDHVRVFVELKDGVSGEIKWSEHFDRRGTRVIDIQDEIAREITGTLWSYKGAIREAAHDKLSRKPTQDFNAFDSILKGIYHKEKFTAKDQLQAHECFDKAIELDSDSAEALGWRAWAHIIDITMGWSDDSAVSLAQAYSDARRAIELDPYSEMGHWALGEAFITDKKYERGFEEYDKALEINPNNPDLIVTKGTELSIYGQFDDGIELIHQGIEFNKHHPEWYFWHLGIACFAANRLSDAIKAFNHMNSQNKDSLIYLTASYALVEELDEAKKHVLELIRIEPNINLDDIAASHDFLSEESCQQLIDGLNLAMGNKKPLKKLQIV